MGLLDGFLAGQRVGLLNTPIDPVHLADNRFVLPDSGGYGSVRHDDTPFAFDRPDLPAQSPPIARTPFGFYAPTGAPDARAQRVQYVPVRPALPLPPGPFWPGTPDNAKWTKGFIEDNIRAGKAIGDAIWGILHNDSENPADKPASTPIGRRGEPIEVTPGTNTPTDIGGRTYTGHGLDRMQGRGVPPTPVEDVIQNGRQSPGNDPGTVAHTDDDNGVEVITGPDGQVVTVKTVKRKK